MRKIIKQRDIVDDAVVHVADGEPLPANGTVTVSLERWQAERDALTARGDVGVRLTAADEPEALFADVAALALVAVEFSKFTDGRGYSTARLLRERGGYSGELRAVGHVLRDQLLYMHRVGFDAFELSPDKDIEGALEAFRELSVKYQPAVDEKLPLYRRVSR